MKKIINQNGSIHTLPLLLIIAAVGIISFLLISSTVPFKGGLFSVLNSKPASHAASSSWSQDAHDPQRTSYTPDQPAEPWTYTWSFNGPDSNGGITGHLYNAPQEGRIVAGGGNVYAPAGGSGLYAVNESNGGVVWHSTNTTFNASPAYDPSTGNLIAGSHDGNLYEFNSQTGSVIATFNATSPIDKAILIVGNFAYFITNAGNLYKVKINSSGLDASPAATGWSTSYNGGSSPGTMPAYSLSRDIIIYCTNNTNGAMCHGVNNTNGSKKWAVQPTIDNNSNLVPTTYPNSTYTYNEFVGWPAVADKHGLVLVSFNLGDINEHIMATLPPSTGNYFPTGAVNGATGTNTTVRNWLIANPKMQSYFALSLDTGSQSFVPAIGYSGFEGQIPGLTTTTTDLAHTMGQFPVIKTWSNGDEVAYTAFRNGTCAQANNSDYRWDGVMGEMELDATTIPGLNAGDLRIVGWGDFCGFADAGNKSTTYLHIIDERMSFSMAGDTLFYSHWGAADSASITNRAPSLGMTVSSPITASTHLSNMYAVQPCGTKDSTTHYTSGSCVLFGDTRQWNGPMFWTYWGTQPTLSGGNGGTYIQNPNTAIVTDGLLITEGAGGELMAFKTAVVSTPPPSPLPSVTPSSSPTPAASLTPTPAPSATPRPSTTPPSSATPAPSASPNPCNGADVNHDGIVNLLDYSIVVSNFGKSEPPGTNGDINGNGVVDLLDYSIVVSNFGKTGC